ncbi:MAG TPA: leucyl/phenylalanyl-tRNA--protein transferase [Methylophaga sp.]|nr:leucyl/phenylalanyl-tRNA--protein transferase [Methylophaga sp.]
MSLTWLAASVESCFPAVENARADGLLAAGGDLSSQRLIDAYQQGIFPWFNQHDPILWWSPDPRMVLFTNQVKISRSLKKTLRDTTITVTADTAFVEVITACSAPRDNQTSAPENSTWIHPDMINAYTELHQQGTAHSIECWHDGNLVGGLYGIAIGQIFFGESMFSTMRDSSKIALVTLCQQLQRWGYPVIDCQIHSEHLASMGASEISRDNFISYLDKYCTLNSSNRAWRLDSDLPLLS